jgi:hypothetical protein
VIQFTATPFREDGGRVDGEFIYTYPLKKAQQEGYFKPIRFEAVFGLDQPDADQAIIDKLGESCLGPGRRPQSSGDGPLQHDRTRQAPA